MNQTITITFGDHAENHRGMQIISATPESEGLSHGLSVGELEKLRAALNENGFVVELCHLDHSSTDESEPAAILIIRGGVNKILSTVRKNADDVYVEHARLVPDKTILTVSGEVVKKVARWNLCYGEHAQEPDIAAGRGTVIPWSSVPLTNAIRKFISILSPKLRHLVGEGNFYYDSSKCDIQPHGDLERSVVVAMRLGASMPLFYQWFYYGRPLGNIMRFDLHHGDMYTMSSCAVGTHNATSSAPVLKHWACGPKFRI